MPAPNLLASVVERRAAALRKHLPAALAGEVTGVHQARVASRRLRETLPILAGAGAGASRRAQRAVRRVTRALGPVREMDVALDVLASHVKVHPDEVVEGMVVRGWLDRLRADHREAMLEALDELQVARLWARIERLDGLLAPIDDETMAPLLRALGGRIEQRALALAAEVARTGVLYAPEPLHGVRIATKKLRYALELAGELRPHWPTAAVVRALKRHQDLLGRIHDLEVLSGLADRACAEAPRRVHAARLVGDWQRECRELHARYLRTRVALERAGRSALAVGRRLSRAGTPRRHVTARRPSNGA